jgi:phage terminase large subunit-like protein
LTKFYFDDKAANKAIGFIEKFCTHTKGDLAGEPLLLEPFQKKIVGDLFGWKNKKTNLRQYKVALIQLPRKNGKTTLAAGIICYCLFSLKERGNELYAAAGDRGQANIIFSIVSQMVLQNEHLSQRANVFRSSIVNESKGNYFQAISSDSKTKHGFSAGVVVMDELHVQKNRDLYDTLLTSTGARSEPLFISITTSGYDKQSIGYEIYSYAKKVKDKVLKDDSFYPCIFEADKDDDITLESTWIKANPNYGVSLRKDYMQRESQRAKDVPSYLNTFKRLHLNIWTDSYSAWLTAKEWDDCYVEYDYKSLEGKQCWGGIDLSTTRDISAVVLLFYENEKFIILPFFFIPKDNLKNRRDRDGVDYEMFVRDNHVIATEGNVIDYNVIKEKINELGNKYKIQSMSYDRWNASMLISSLIEDYGINMSPLGMGFVSQSAPTKEMEKLILEKKIVHNNNPAANWMLSNVSLMEDPAGNIKISKSKSKSKIDFVAALILALADYMSCESGDSVYDTRGILMI